MKLKLFLLSMGMITTMYSATLPSAYNFRIMNSPASKGVTTEVDYVLEDPPMPPLVWYKVMCDLDTSEDHDPIYIDAEALKWIWLDNVIIGFSADRPEVFIDNAGKHTLTIEAQNPNLIMHGLIINILNGSSDTITISNCVGVSM